MRNLQPKEMKAIDWGCWPGRRSSLDRRERSSVSQPPTPESKSRPVMEFSYAFWAPLPRLEGLIGTAANIEGLYGFGQILDSPKIRDRP
jgi:hypothetical protein